MKGYVPQLVAMGVVVGALLGTYQPAFPGHHGSHVVVAPGGQAPRVGPSNLYPDPELTPGAINPNVTQGNIQQTICKSGWTDTIRPPTSFTNNLKAQQLQATRYKDKMPSHYEEDHFIALEIGGNPNDPKNLWAEMWGSPAHPLTHTGPFPPEIVGAKSKDWVETHLKGEVCAGRMTLKDAQDIIQTDWFKYYRYEKLK